jgi:hypothetical protein
MPEFHLREGGPEMKRVFCCLAVLAVLVVPASADIQSGFSFTATGSPTTLALVGPDQLAHGLSHGLSMVAVPEPGFYSEFAVNLGGLTMLMLVRRKRQA